MRHELERELTELHERRAYLLTAPLPRGEYVARIRALVEDDADWPEPGPAFDVRQRELHRLDRRIAEIERRRESLP